MSIRWIAACSVVVLLTLAAITAGCDETPLLAPSDGQLTLLATPQTAAPNTQLDPTEATYFSTVGAQLLSMESQPLVDRRITFYPSAGTLTFNSCSAGTCKIGGGLCTSSSDCDQPAPGPVNVDTDSSGVATVQLAVTANDPESVTVTALSGSLSGMTTVNNPLGVPNEFPEAVIDATPESPLDASGGPRSVRFSGADSSDPDDDPITCYEWTLSGSLSPTETVRGPSFVSIQRTYSAEQSLIVQLQVTDDPDAATSCNSSTIFSPNADIIDYLVCTNTAPTAAIQVIGSSSQTLPVGGGTVSFNLSGTGSTDPQTGIKSYSWNCDNGSRPTGSTVTCAYSTAGVYDVTLTVDDFGNGEADCSLESTPATTTLIVNNP